MFADIEEKYKNQKIQLIEELTKLLPFYEWDKQLLSEAEAECGFAKGYHYILFPESIDEIIDSYEDWHDELMMQYLALEEKPAKIRERISKALKIRIKNCSSQIICKKNKNYFLKSPNVLLGSKVAWRTCDKIWRYAGDESIDFNYYTKRGLLLGVYLSSIMFYISDESENYIKTDNFIDEALAKIINIISLKKLAKLPSIEDIPILRLFS